MEKSYKEMSDRELWTRIEQRHGTETRSIFENREKRREALERDDGLLREHFDRISRGC